MKLFPRTPTPYYIWSPPWTHKSSGVMTLHLLCNALNESGEKAYIIPNDYAGFSTNPDLNTPLLSVEHQNFYGDNFIAVYSDVIKGNPFNAKHVVRYLLAPRGAYGGDKVFPETDQVWGALPSIAENVLRIPVSAPAIFYPPFSVSPTLGLVDDRHGSCFYAHKYELHGNKLLDEFTGSSTRLQGSREQLADILRKSEVCYIYEVTSAMTEASLCGCPVVLVRTPYFNTIDPACMMGNVKWSDGEIVKENDNYIVEYQKFIDDFPKQIENFIKKTKELL